MRLGIVGGRLQGVEAAYLGRKAGFEVVLVDRRSGVPAAGLADEFHVLDVGDEAGPAAAVLGRCDVVLPACEDVATLTALEHVCADVGVPLAFDRHSYSTTSSKSLSNDLMERLEVPRPAPWPECGYPVVVKPDGESGSHGVAIAWGDEDLDRCRAAVHALGQAPVVQQFVPGVSLSVEVVGFEGQAYPYQVTELEFDRGYDCKRVIAPAAVDDRTQRAMADAGVGLADTLDLRGIMDVEAMVGARGTAIIEIDARLPSQTPAAVFHSTGVNLVELLARAALGQAPPAWTPTQTDRGAVYQHVAVENGIGSVVGEGRFGRARPLRLVPGFFGSDEALTDYEPGSDSWVATLITTGSDASAARAAGGACIEAIAEGCGLDTIIDEDPPDLGSVGPLTVAEPARNAAGVAV